MGGIVSGVLFLLVVVAFSIWLCGAIWFHGPGPWRHLFVALALVAAVGLIILRYAGYGLAGWIGLMAGLLIGAGWWTTLKPAKEADWAPDVAFGATAEIGERQVTVHHVRSFRWHTEFEATESWITERYDPDTITSLDLASSVWGNPAIAHTLVSFGFADGRHLAFSAEVRRRHGQDFSSFAGFFRTSELVLIAAEETDILYLRSNVRREQLSLYPLRATPAEARRLFLTYLDTGNDLASSPRFYNTITANCTTVIFDLARLVGSNLPYSWQILASGYLPKYLYDEGLIRTNLPWPVVERLALTTSRARATMPEGDYSSAIRSVDLFRQVER